MRNKIYHFSLLFLPDDDKNWMHISIKMATNEKSGILNGNAVKVDFIMRTSRRRERYGDEKYIINQSDSLILIWLVFLDGI